MLTMNEIGNVSDPARVTFTPTVQYLPLRMSGVVRCHVEAEPSFQFITWTKNKRIFDPYETPNVALLKNGSLLFDKVILSHTRHVYLYKGLATQKIFVNPRENLKNPKIWFKKSQNPKNPKKISKSDTQFFLNVKKIPKSEQKS